MLLTSALLRSTHGIALRHRTVKLKAGRELLERHFAVASDKGAVHVINGRNGTIRRMDAADQARSDWEPFQAMPERKSGRKIKSVKLQQGDPL